METKRKKGTNSLIIGSLLMFLIIGFVHAQFERWEYTHTGTGTANTMVYGPNSTIYAAGYVEMATDGNDFVVVGLDNVGNEAFVYAHEGPGGGYSNDDRANAVVYGSDGNIYATGYVSLAGYTFDLCVSSLTYDGTERWAVERGSPAGTNDVGKAITYGADNNVYVAGYTDLASPGDSDFVVVKFDNAGNFGWYYTYVTSNDDVANAIVYGGDDNIYAAGFATNTDKDFVVASIDTSGNENWIYTYNASGGDEAANSIVYGPDGNIYAAGYINGNGNDFFVVSLDTDGNENWTYSYDGPGNNNDKANAIIYGDDGNLYVAGLNTSTNNDFTVISLDTSGDERWVHSHNGVDDLDDEAKSIVYGGDDNIYAAGFVRSINQKDFAVICVDNTGEEIWVYVKDGGSPMIANDEANAIAYGTDGYVYSAGYIRTGTFPSFYVVSLDPTPIPEIWVSPFQFSVIIDSGTTTDRPLKIGNDGPGPLEWSISEKLGSDWLIEDDTIGTAASGEVDTAMVTFDATNLIPDEYYDTLIVSSNDPYNPIAEIAVRLKVNPGQGIEDSPYDAFEDRLRVTSPFFNKQISLSFTKPSDTPCEISLYNILGMKIHEISLPSTPSSINLDDEDISKLSNGVYFLSVRRLEKFYPVEKLIKY